MVQLMVFHIVFEHTKMFWYLENEFLFFSFVESNRCMRNG